MASESVVPDDMRDLLERPLYGHLGTVRPDGTPQVNPMWFRWDGEHIYFTHTTGRRKYRNLQTNPNVALSITDPENPYRYLEVRGAVERIEPDPTGAFYVQLAERYGRPMDAPPPDAPNRVILVMRPTRVTRH